MLPTLLRPKDPLNVLSSHSSGLSLALKEYLVEKYFLSLKNKIGIYLLSYSVLSKH